VESLKSVDVHATVELKRRSFAPTSIIRVLLQGRVRLETVAAVGERGVLADVVLANLRHITCIEARLRLAMLV